MQIDPGTMLAAGGLLIGGIVWLVRLEGRINVNESRHEDIIGRLSRIENKIDQSNGKH